MEKMEKKGHVLPILMSNIPEFQEKPNIVCLAPKGRPNDWEVVRDLRRPWYAKEIRSCHKVKKHTRYGMKGTNGQILFMPYISLNITL